MPNQIKPDLSSEIPVVLSRSDFTSYPETGNVVPVLNEVMHALRQLAQENQSTTIDLLSIPMAPGESDRLFALLGQGEVKASIDALGPSEVNETIYPGVWTVIHRNLSGQVIGRFIEITHCPSILFSQDQDINNTISQLRQTLDQLVSEAVGGNA